MKNKEQFIKAFEKLPDGVDAVEVMVSEGDSFKVDVQDGKIEVYDISHRQSLALRADCGEVGVTYTESMTDDPMRLIELAQENASIVRSEDAPFMRFYEGGDHYEATAPIDPKLLMATEQEKIDLAMELERKIIKKDSAIKRVVNAMVATGTQKSSLFNSLGLLAEGESGSAMMYVSPVAEKDGDIKNGMGIDMAKNLQELDIDYVVDMAWNDVMGQFNATTPRSGTYDIIMKNSALGDLLEAFTSMFSADAAQKGLSLLAGREGDTIGSNQVTILDDPMNARVLHKIAYDSEGVPTKKKAVIQDGVLMTLLHNRKTASKAGVQTTGNASGSGVIGVAPTHFLLEEGDYSLDDLCDKMQNGLYITDVSGLHAGTNAVSGDFSLLCQGFLVQNGKIGQAVEQITIAGNFLTMLEHIVAVGNDTRFPIITTPSALIEGMHVAGK